MALPTLLLRAEDKQMEHRSALTPTTAATLLRAGYPVLIERSPTSPLRKRIFPDAEFNAAGCTLVDAGSWVDSPPATIVIGLKELDESDPFPLHHAHVTFAHCYKGQGGWEGTLNRWRRGGGTLYDLEFLTDSQGRRVAAFGYHAGFAGAALAIKTWAWQVLHPEGTPLPGVDAFTEGKGYYESEGQLVEQIRRDVAAGERAAGKKPRVLVIGALGRCGRGAVDACALAGLPDNSILKWDLPETAPGGPFPQILASDIFVNCIYLSSPIPPFISPAGLASPARALSVVCDISCDTTNPHNPVPIYSANTTFDSPTAPVKYEGAEGPRMSVIAIDHLPSLLPRESSEAFSGALLPHLLELKNRDQDPVWKGAEALFREKVATLPREQE